jgi:hypothetical protein
MKGVLWLTLFSLILNVAMGQKRLTQVHYARDSAYSCGHVTLGSGFEKSGMVQYVARPKIIESKWTDRQLNIKIFVVSDCCPPDFLGYTEQSDTLNLYWGDKKSIPDEHGTPKEVDICMCGSNGCCYEFEYSIAGLKRNTNYLVAVSDILGIGRVKPYPIGYTDSKEKSVYYSNECDSFDACLDEKIDEAILHYRKLAPLYDSLIVLHKSGSTREKDMVYRIKQVWISYFKCREAIYDEYISSKIESNLYNARTRRFELEVTSELQMLEPRLSITNEYLQGGSLIEPIKYKNSRQ